MCVPKLRHTYQSRFGGGEVEEEGFRRGEEEEEWRDCLRRRRKLRSNGLAKSLGGCV